MIDVARHSHPPVTHDDSGRRDRLAGEEEGRSSAPLEGELPPPAAMAVPRTMSFNRGHLPVLRRFVRERAAEQHLDARATEDLVLAVNELAINSLQYGGGGGHCSHGGRRTHSCSRFATRVTSASRS